MKKHIDLAVTIILALSLGTGDALAQRGGGRAGGARPGGGGGGGGGARPSFNRTPAMNAPGAGSPTANACRRCRSPAPQMPAGCVPPGARPSPGGRSQRPATLPAPGTGQPARATSPGARSAAPTCRNTGNRQPPNIGNNTGNAVNRPNIGNNTGNAVNRPNIGNNTGNAVNRPNIGNNTGNAVNRPNIGNNTGNTVNRPNIGNNVNVGINNRPAAPSTPAMSTSTEPSIILIMLTSIM